MGGILDSVIMNSFETMAKAGRLHPDVFHYLRLRQPFLVSAAWGQIYFWE